MHNPPNLTLYLRRKGTNMKLTTSKEQATFVQLKTRSG